MASETSEPEIDINATTTALNAPLTSDDFADIESTQRPPAAQTPPPPPSLDSTTTPTAPAAPAAAAITSSELIAPPPPPLSGQPNPQPAAPSPAAASQPAPSQPAPMAPPITGQVPGGAMVAPPGSPIPPPPPPLGVSVPEMSPEMAQALDADATISIEFDDVTGSALAPKGPVVEPVPSAEKPSSALRDPFGFDLYQAAHSAQHATALAVAAALLDNDEQVKAVIAGRFLAHNAVAVTTERRVLLVNDKHLRPDVVSVPLEQMGSNQRWDHDKYITLVLRTTAGDTYVIGSISHPASVKRFLTTLSPTG